MWSLILCWGAGDRVNTYSIISQSHPSRRAPPPCHYVSPSHQPPAGFHVPAAISPLIQKHVSAWQKQGAESHFMRSLRRRRGSWVKRKFKVVKGSENQRVKAVLKKGGFWKTELPCVGKIFFQCFFFSPWRVSTSNRLPGNEESPSFTPRFVSLATCFTLAGS